MIYVLISIILIATVAVVANILAKSGKLSAELARKLVHMTLGMSIFVTSIFSNKTWTAALLSISLGAVVIARESGLFSSFRKVGRRSNGDLYYLIGVLGALILASSQAAFGIAVLILTFADAAAAIVGKAAGKHQFHVIGETKSIEGSLTFLLVAAVIIATYVVFGPSSTRSDYILLAVLPLVLMIFELASPKGLDNLSLPIAATLLVNLLS
ncbi:MAG: hypothetical protein KIH63_003445 [Candidatus Saccharibacteria bacterium]|nr:hypothetical protein [Candidatus Saccharibacteria bacterium]